MLCVCVGGPTGDVPCNCHTPACTRHASPPAALLPHTPRAQAANALLPPPACVRVHCDLQCGASRTVQAIKAGFVARVTKRVAEQK